MHYLVEAHWLQGSSCCQPLNQCTICFGERKESSKAYFFPKILTSVSKGSPKLTALGLTPELGEVDGLKSHFQRSHDIISPRNVWLPPCPSLRLTEASIFSTRSEDNNGCWAAMGTENSSWGVREALRRMITT